MKWKPVRRLRRHRSCFGFSRILEKLGICLCLLSHLAYAREDIVSGSRYTAARAASMGDAFLPMGRDVSSALFYNPAIFGKFQGTAFEALNVSGYGNLNIPALLGGNVFAVPQLSQVAPTLASSPETFVSAGASVAPAFQFGRIGFGVLINHQVGAQANNDGSYRYRTLRQMVPAFGLGFPFFKGRLRLGYSVQWVNQASGDVFQNSSDGLDYGTGLSEGSGFSHTLGLALNVGPKFVPELNIVVRNLGGLKYTPAVIMPMSLSSVGTPPDEPTTVDVSLSISTLKSRKGPGSASFLPGSGGKSITSLTWVLQLRDLTSASRVPLEGRIATGVELNTGRWAFRGGWGSGYPSAGLGYASRKFELNLAWCSEDISSVYHEVQDMRLMLQMQLNFR